MKFDRMWNKVEKFNARAMTDVANHDRREKRMIQKREKRWNENYTFFFGELTEEEQQYRDYYETDIELHREDEVMDAMLDDKRIAETGDFNPSRFEFVDYTAV